MARRLLVCGAGAALFLAVSWSVDRAVDVAAVRAGRHVDAVFFQGYVHHPEAGYSAGGNHAYLNLVGLRGGAPVSLRLVLAAKVGRVRILANREEVGQALLEPFFQTFEMRAVSNAEGRITIQFESVRLPDVLVRVSSVQVRHERAGAVPSDRLAQYLLCGLLAASAGWRIRQRPRAALLAAGAVTAALGASLAFHRCYALAYLPAALWTVGLIEAWLSLAELGAWLLVVPASDARWLVMGSLLRMGLVVNPAFASADLFFHTNRLLAFRTHQPISSGAPGIELVPYPPAFYALLAPLASDDYHANVRLVRLAMGLLEAASPLLVLALARVAGFSREAAGAAAVAAALLPEGLLVLAKGIACNILGTFTMLLVLVSWMKTASWPARAGTLSVAFLSHAPAAVTTAALLLGWWMLSLGRGELDRQQLARRLSVVAAAAMIAWLAYYREVPLIFGGSLEAAREEGGLVYVRVYRAGKVLQDLLLKFGLLPLALAWQGLRAVDVPPARSLLQAWLGTGLLLGLAAVLTPFPLRFEYFLCPAVSLAAGLGAARLRASGRGRWVTVCWSVALLVQAGIGALHLAGRFELISVVLESPRWPFPVKL